MFQSLWLSMFIPDFVSAEINRIPLKNTDNQPVIVNAELFSQLDE